MSHPMSDPAERERRRWTRENAHLYNRHDAHRFMRPDAPGWVHPDHKLWNLYFRYPERQPDEAGAAPVMAERRALERAWPAVGEASGPSPGELLNLKSDLAALWVQLAVIRHEIAARKARGLPPLTEADEGWQIILRSLARYHEACRKAGFNPDQPRVPAGNPDGGQWTSGDNAGNGSDTGAGRGTGGGINDPRILSDATPGNDWIPGAQYAQNESEKERLLNKHIKDDHVEKTDAELIERIRREQVRGPFISGGRDRNGSFDSVESARDFIRQTIENNSETVSRVASGESAKELLTWRFGYPTGREAYLDHPDGEIRIRKTYNVGVVVGHDPTSSLGFRVITAYPRNYNSRIGR